MSNERASTNGQRIKLLLCLPNSAGLGSVPQGMVIRPRKLVRKIPLLVKSLTFW